MQLGVRDSSVQASKEGPEHPWTRSATQHKAGWVRRGGEGRSRRGRHRHHLGQLNTHLVSGAGERAQRLRRLQRTRVPPTEPSEMAQTACKPSCRGSDIRSALEGHSIRYTTQPFAHTIFYAYLLLMQLYAYLFS